MGGEQNNGNSKKLRNRICVGYIERNLVGKTDCSSVCKNWKMGELFDFERGQIVVLFTGKCVTKIATSLGVLRATVSEAVSAYVIHGKTVSAKRNSG
jgi:hypothetical protein